jgi:hypothetical protein
MCAGFSIMNSTVEVTGEIKTASHRNLVVSFDSERPIPDRGPSAVLTRGSR